MLGINVTPAQLYGLAKKCDSTERRVLACSLAHFRAMEALCGDQTSAAAALADGRAAADADGEGEGVGDGEGKGDGDGAVAAPAVAAAASPFTPPASARYVRLVFQIPKFEPTKLCTSPTPISTRPKLKFICVETSPVAFHESIHPPKISDWLRTPNLTITRTFRTRQVRLGY